MEIRVFENGKGFDTYTVIINGQFYTMSHNPTAPNGVNSYLGTAEDGYMVGEHLGKEVEFTSLSHEVKRAITDRLVRI